MTDNVMGMDLFAGITDPSSIGDVTVGLHTFELTEVDKRHNEETDVHNLVIKWTVCDDNDPDFAKDYSRWYRIFPNVTVENIKELSVKERAEYTRHMKFLKTGLNQLGYKDNQLAGLSPEKIAEEKVGIKAHILIGSYTKENRTYLTMEQVNLVDGSSNIAVDGFINY